jgi:hypothetical protein
MKAAFCISGMPAAVGIAGSAAVALALSGGLQKAGSISASPTQIAFIGSGNLGAANPADRKSGGTS